MISIQFCKQQKILSAEGLSHKFYGIYFIDMAKSNGYVQVASLSWNVIFAEINVKDTQISVTKFHDSSSRSSHGSCHYNPGKGSTLPAGSHQPTVNDRQVTLFEICHWYSWLEGLMIYKGHFQMHLLKFVVFFINFTEVVAKIACLYVCLKGYRIMLMLLVELSCDECDLFQYNKLFNFAFSWCHMIKRSKTYQ